MNKKLKRIYNRWMPGGRQVVIGIPFLWLFLFFMLPFFIVLKISFAEADVAIPPYTDIWQYAEGKIDIALNLANYLLLGDDELYFSAYLGSLKMAFFSTLLCVLIGYPMAYAMSVAKEVIRRHDHVVAGMAGQQLALKRLVGIEHVIRRLDASRFLEVGQRGLANVVGPVVDLHRAGRVGAGRECKPGGEQQRLANQGVSQVEILSKVIFFRRQSTDRDTKPGRNLPSINLPGKMNSLKACR